ncbi:helix-turn-helix domain-containing protein [Texcoconibacillus texcoconensis]|uniref:Cytoskeletal protein RodZ n=1 Tax=Texcoconibacillus texcoconensis TaxID=1095777 RepID=A0A840QKP2_9BACI|nr:RodZ family helix-turn-helix domain-containing protein [Texcoconibacillus texcoconensis]MBB5172007.1 cytoskeletal protein RodZ [Texcoconibacillus texcoconensis]
MSELGQRLKAAREEKQYSYEQLQSVTKIQKRYLEAIEEGDFDRLPGDFYARAFVKNYAEAVGLDPDELFDEYANELPKPKGDTVDIPPRSSRKSELVSNRKSRFTSFIPSLIVIVFIVAIFVGIWFFVQDNDGDTGVPNDEQQGGIDVEGGDDELPYEDELEGDEGVTDEAEAAESEDSTDEQLTEGREEEEKEEEEEREEEAEQTPVLEFDETEGINSYFDLIGAEDFDVEIRFTGRSWLQIEDETGTVHEVGEFDEGEELSFDFVDQEEITFNLGSALTTDIKINGEELDYQIDDTRQFVIVRNLPDETL